MIPDKVTHSNNISMMYTGLSLEVDGKSARGPLHEVCISTALGNCRCHILFPCFPLQQKPCFVLLKICPQCLLQFQRAMATPSRTGALWTVCTQQQRRWLKALYTSSVCYGESKEVKPHHCSSPYLHAVLNLGYCSEFMPHSCNQSLITFTFDICSGLFNVQLVI